jgi:hypothetical protein
LTPNWYAGLPSDVKAYFGNEAESTATEATTRDSLTAYRTPTFLTHSTTSADLTTTTTTSDSRGTTGTRASASATSSPKASGSAVLSTGAIAGIAVAAVLAIAVITGLVVWFILERSKSSKALPVTEEPPAMGAYENTAYQGPVYQQYQNGPYQSVPNPASNPVGYEHSGQPLYDPVKLGPAGVVESGAQEVYEVDGATAGKR